jgi:hypothetical protein
MKKLSLIEEQTVHALPNFLKILIAVQIKTPEVNHQCQEENGVEDAVKLSFDQDVRFHTVYPM